MLFAVDNLAHWCQHELPQRFPTAAHLLLEADGGGSNASRSRVFKQQLQALIAEVFRLTVTVCHPGFTGELADGNLCDLSVHRSACPGYFE